MSIVWPIIWFALLGAFFGILLAVASVVFKVERDPKEEEITKTLPGANCGGCGYAGCAALAAAIVKGEAPTSACTAGGAEISEAIAGIMGTTADKSERKRAQVMCSGHSDTSALKYEYRGISDCSAASALIGGTKVCPNGCIGFGSCADACKFDAIEIKDGVATVNYEKCTGCGACVKACPKNLIFLIPFEAQYWVGCQNVFTGKQTRSYCKVGCIGCKICEKNCPTGAIKVENNNATIDYEKCIGCGVCAEKCPRHIIFSGKVAN